MRFKEAYGDWLENRLTQEEAALILGVRTAAQITTAIASIGSMSQFRATGSNPLTAAQIAAIAAISH